jgi:hypothetical protein
MKGCLGRTSRLHRGPANGRYRRIGVTGDSDPECPLSHPKATFGTGNSALQSCREQYEQGLCQILRLWPTVTLCGQPRPIFPTPVQNVDLGKKFTPRGREGPFDFSKGGRPREVPGVCLRNAGRRRLGTNRRANCGTQCGSRRYPKLQDTDIILSFCIICWRTFRLRRTTQEQVTRAPA